MIILNIWHQFKKMLLYINVFFIQQRQLDRESDIKLSKIKEKKLNTIKSEMEEIKKFILSNDDLDSYEQNKNDYLNNNDGDTLTLTKIVNKKEKIINNNTLDELKKELKELKNAVSINKNLLNEILLKLK